LTDRQHDTVLPITFIDVSEYELDTWWNKVLIFKYSEYGLYFDLDVDIRKKVDFLLDDIEDGSISVVDTPWKDSKYFSQKETMLKPEAYLMYGNTSVMGWKGDHTYLVDMLLGDVFKHTTDHFGDDTFINTHGRVKYFRAKYIDSDVGKRWWGDPSILINYVVRDPQFLHRPGDVV